MKQAEYSNIKESINNTTHKQSKTKTVYVVNFTSIRLLIFSLSAFALVVFIFVIGFHLGSSKPTKVANYDDVRSALLREDGNTFSSSSVPENTSSLDIEPLTPSKESELVNLKTMSNPLESTTFQENISLNTESASQNYNEYTKALSEELNAINNSIREKTDLSLNTPNTTYTPPTIEYTVPKAKPTVKKAEDTKISTKVPYSSSVASGDIIYFIQVAVIFNKESAYKEKDRLTAKFPKVFIKEDLANDASSTMYKLKIGRFDTKADAEKVLAEIKKVSGYKDSYIYTDKKVK